MYDIKEVRGVRPFEACVVDHEFAVGGNEWGLDGGQVGADDLGGGELVSKITNARVSTVGIAPCIF